MIKVAYVLAYKSPNYTRTQFLLNSLQGIEDVFLIEVINKHTGLLRYPEVILRLLWNRIKHRPDVYILGFRGVEVYWPVRIISLGKPLIYDEFLNPYLWIVEEYKKISKNNFFSWVLKLYLFTIYKSADLTLSDTKLHAEYSAALAPSCEGKFMPIYVGANEYAFNLDHKLSATKNGYFTVFFYGNFLPLHGLEEIVLAAEKLKSNKNIKFVIVGGANKQKRMTGFLDTIKRKKLGNIKHVPWVNYKDLPKHIASADVCLGGPFGNTPQSKKVITGKTFQFLAMGKPTIVGAIDEQVGFVDKKNCFLIQQGSADGIAQAILWSYENQNELKDIGQQGRRLYEQKFSVKAQKGLLEGMLKSLVEKN